MKTIKVLRWSYLFLFIFVAFCLFFVYKISHRDFSSELEYSREKKQIDSSIFSAYKGQIYASVPSNGDYLIQQADLATFHLIDQSYQSRHVAADKNHVYCGNLILEKLNPSTTTAIGNDYLSDGQKTYYCSGMTIKNPDLGIVAEVSQLVLNLFGLYDKPQTWIYPFKEVSNIQQSSNMNGLVTSQNQVLLNGQELPKANAQSLRKINRLYADGDTRPSEVYTADGRHVYAKNTLLNMMDSADLYSLAIDAQNQDEYLIEPKSGMVYLNDFSFDPSHAPYRILSMNGAHANHTLWLSNDGIYFYDREDKKVRRAADNVFNRSNFTEIAPLIFFDGKTLLYLQDKQVWGGNKNPGLKSISTEILQLDEPMTGQWKKIGDVNYRYGQVWQNGSTTYYFDQLGSGQSIKQTIYKIVDPTLLAELSNPNIRTDDLREILSSNRVAIPKSNVVAFAKTKYSDGHIWAVLFPVIFLGIISLVFWIMRQFKINPKPFDIDENYLQLNNIFSKKIALADIDCVYFTKTYMPRSRGYVGRICVHQKNGKKTRNLMFQAKMSLFASSAEEMDAYILEMQNLLKQHGVKSYFDQN
ncbi:DKNYY domain-containing protein [Acinetobacter gerneri]|uniref:DKNYY domain-containing protein n=1 Tax=Acinetobacter gerneri TaxID=202952 RepID=UPI002935609E|nr:DKNYY domain-containing protein [Acinetobacter gerneri]MDV2438666.1 DKNYY domain-containing protein [Acinetobacter gerneri]